MRKVLLLMVLLIPLSVNAQFQMGYCGKNLFYYFYPDTKELIIDGSGEMENYSPSNRAPWYDMGVKTVEICNTTNIGDYAFNGCTSLTSVVISSSVRSIGASAFYGCTGITNVETLNSVRSIGASAFYGCTGITNITFGDVLTTIGASAFYGCTGLDFIKIPDSVRSIGDSAFRECSKVSTLNMGNSAVSIGESAFYNCKNLRKVYWEDSVTNIGDYAFYGCSRLESIRIPNSVKSIGAFAFYDCTNLAVVTIGNSVTSIGNAAFYRCPWIVALYIPNSVTSMGEGAFYNCPKLEVTISLMDEEDFANYLVRDDLLKTFYPDHLGSKPHIISINGVEQTSITIPNSVTHISDYAFRNCAGLTSVTIPNSVNDIGSYAFSNCSRLSSIEIPNTVTHIGDNAFSGCAGLTSVTIPNSVNDIGKFAFEDCSGLSSIEIPNSVTSIGWSAFRGCVNLPVENGIRYADTYLIGAVEGNLTDAIIKEGTRFIGEGAFYNCSGLTSIEIPQSVICIGSSAFADCTSLTSIEIPNSVVSIGESAFENCSGLTSIEIPNAITRIGYRLFKGCSGLTSIEIPNSVTSVGDSAFDDCISLISVTIGNSVAEIGECTFRHCSNLKEIHCKKITPPEIEGNVSDVFNGVESKNCKLYVPEGCIEQYRASKWAFFKNIIEETVQLEILTGYCGKDGNNLTYTLDIKTGVMKIEGSGDMIGYATSGSAPWHDYNVKAVEFSNSLTSVGSYAFEGCSGLTSIEIPNSVTRIHSSAFQGCTGLTSVTIPNSVTNLYEGVFEGCSSINEVNIYINDEADFAYYLRRNDLYSIFHNVELAEKPHNILINGVKQTSITIPNSVTSIGDWAFNNCSGLTNVIIPNSVTSIGESVFCRCTSLTDVDIPNSVTSIGKCAFFECSGLTKVAIGNSVTSIGADAFCDCNIKELIINSNSLVTRDYSYHGGIIGYFGSQIEKVVLSSSLDGIGNYVFSGFSSLTSIEIPNSVTSIGDYAFNGCSSLTNVVIPNSVTSIGDYAFNGCSSLTSIVIPNSLANINIGMFNGCTSLTNIVIPNSVTTIFDYAFYGCSGLASVEIPNSVTGIYDAAFSGCSSLTSIVIPNSVTDIDCRVFENCTRLASVTISNSLTILGWATFRNCSSLTNVVIPSSVTRIYDSAFSGCSNLRVIHSYNTTPPEVEGGVFSGVDTYNCKLYVPLGCSERYRKAAVWEDFVNIIEDVVHATEINIDFESIELIKGNTKQLSATVLPENADFKDFIWSSSNLDVASVSSDGLVMANSSGEAYIYATLVEDNSIVDYCIVKVIQPVTSVLLSAKEKELKVGETYSLNAIVNPYDADNKNIIWTSSDSEVASVDNGIVTALKAGSAKIIAVSEDNTELSDYCEISVIQPTTGIELNHSSYTLGAIGKSVELIATVLPEDATNKNVNWKSSNESICYVSNGKVVALNYGTAVIIATTVDGGYMATCIVTVNDSDGIESMENYDSQYKIFSINGVETNNVKKGINIIMNKDKTIRKVVYK